MFILKFHLYVGNDQSKTRAVTCSSYELLRENTGHFQVIIHTSDKGTPDLYKTKPDEPFTKGDDTFYFDSCWVETETGTRVDNIRKVEV